MVITSHEDSAHRHADCQPSTSISSQRTLLHHHHFSSSSVHPSFSFSIFSSHVSCADEKFHTTCGSETWTKYIVVFVLKNTFYIFFQIHFSLLPSDPLECLFKFFTTCITTMWIFRHEDHILHLNTHRFTVQVCPRYAKC